MILKNIINHFLSLNFLVLYQFQSSFSYISIYRILKYHVTVVIQVKAFFISFFETRFYYIILAGQELIMYTWMALNSERSTCLSLPTAGIKNHFNLTGNLFQCHAGKTPLYFMSHNLLINVFIFWAKCIWISMYVILSTYIFILLVKRNRVIM